MNFLERYTAETTWQGKVIVMGLYHLMMCYKNKEWTIRNTSNYFKCSMGLTSENIRLANAIHLNPKLMEFATRQNALRKI